MAKIRGLLELMDEALEMDAAKEAVSRLGLKEGNTAADRAKAMGFSDNFLYHGSVKNNPEFSGGQIYDRDLSHLGKQYDKPFEYYGGKAVSLTDDPNVAFRFGLNKDAEKFLSNNNIDLDSGLNITPLRTRGNVFDFRNPNHLKQISGKELYPDGRSKATLNKNMLEDISKGKHFLLDGITMQKLLRKEGFDGVKMLEPKKYAKSQGFNPDAITTKYFSDGVKTGEAGNIRSPFAKFNPKYAGIGAGSIMSSNLLAAPSSEQELKAPDRNDLTRNIGGLLPYMADSYKYVANEGGILGEILYGGGAKALDNLSYGDTPMKPKGHLPFRTPTNESILNLMELLQL